MNGYYRKKLSAERLKAVYDLATPRVRRYLNAEVEHVLGRIRPGGVVIDLGCGYGRIIPELARKAGLLVGIDNSLESMLYGRDQIGGSGRWALAAMDAVRLGFKDGTFDAVVCVQNGISAFKVDPRALVEEGLRVVKPGGRVLFSTYSDKFWKDRLEWFEQQAAAGLLGEIDHKKTSNGDIVCKDGFRATTMTEDRFRTIVSGLNADLRVDEIDASSLFFEMTQR
jgi:2-polyprenyl-6-hydroxyphenyl methylase/3-demethylubiquinone-9 3-methyltransferase